MADLVLATLARIFDSLAIPYLVGGSFASSMYGIPRATQDVDFVADISIIGPLCSESPIS